MIGQWRSVASIPEHLHLGRPVLGPADGCNHKGSVPASMCNVTEYSNRPLQAYRRKYPARLHLGLVRQFHCIGTQEELSPVHHRHHYPTSKASQVQPQEIFVCIAWFVYMKWTHVCTTLCCVHRACGKYIVCVYELCACVYMSVCLCVYVCMCACLHMLCACVCMFCAYGVHVCLVSAGTVDVFALSGIGGPRAFQLDQHLLASTTYNFSGLSKASTT